MSVRNVIIIVLAALFVAGGIWYWRKNRPVPPEQGSSLGVELFEKAQNPIGERLPDTNPFSADTNPFAASVNPFKAEYKNPFR